MCPNVYPMGGPGDWTHMLAGPICFNKLDWRDWKGPFGLNDTRAQQGKNLGGPRHWSWLTFPPLFFFSGPSFFEAGGSVGEDDYPVKLNVMIWTWPVMGGAICYLSEQRQTKGIGLTIIPVNHAHVVDFCVKVYSGWSKIELIMHCIKSYIRDSCTHQSEYVWFQEWCKFTAVHKLSEIMKTFKVNNGWWKSP